MQKKKKNLINKFIVHNKVAKEINILQHVLQFGNQANTENRFIKVFTVTTTPFAAN